MPVAIITGSSRGLGRALAESLLADGWTVHGFARSPQSLVHPHFQAHAVDVGTEASVQAAVATVLAAGRIDLLINNAGAASMNALLLTPAATAEALGAAYVFLRQVEHRIQYLDDQQTHVLPVRDDDLAWIANTRGFENTCAFLAALDAHREVVAQEFDTLLGGDRDCKTCNGKNGKNGNAREHAELDVVLNDFKGPVRDRLAQWTDNPRVLALRDDARGRLMRLLQRTAQWLGEGRISEVAVLRMADWSRSRSQDLKLDTPTAATRPSCTKASRQAPVWPTSIKGSGRCKSSSSICSTPSRLSVWATDPRICEGLVS